MLAKQIVIQGKVYNSYKAAYEFYGIDRNTFYKRKSLGWPLDKCITTEIWGGTRGGKGSLVKDHKGNEFRNINEMCKHWKVRKNTFQNRLNAGLPLEEALTERGHKITDHKENEFKNISEMCEAWGINKNTYYRKNKQGISLKDILEANGTEIKKEKKAVVQKWITDHKGNRFETVDELCKAWKISKQYYYLKKRKGWRLKDILEASKDLEEIEDGIGNEFSGLREMGKYYNLDVVTIRARLSISNWTLPAAIILPKSKKGSNDIRKVFTNIEGVTWYRVREMGNSLYNTEDIIEFYRPDLLKAYLKTNKSERR